MDNVNHPKHYNIPGRKECIEEMIDIFGVDAVRTFCELNAYKYRYRHELKNGMEDLEKAKWYEDYILKLEGMTSLNIPLPKDISDKIIEMVRRDNEKES